MTRFTRFTIVSVVIAIALLLSSCPSPVNIFTGNATGDESPAYQTTAEVTFDAQRGIVVFIEEDGTETPVVVTVDGEEDGPVELIDYSILDDGGATSGRFSQSSNNRIRAIIVGRRRDGRSGVWVIYRHSGVKVLPNEAGDQDSALMDLVEFEGSPYLGDDWVYEATAIKDGKIIIGKLFRPDGWEYLGDSAPDPSIGVFWSICETDENLYVSRARPILMMHKPEPDAPLSRRSGGYRSEWIDMLMEWLQAAFLELSWNYLGTAERFVPDAEVADEGFDAPPEGSYVVEGVDKHGTIAWAWLTYKSVKNIVDAPDSGEPSIEPTVYAGGYRNDGTRDVAVYWVYDEDSTSYVELQPGDIGEVTDIHVDTNDEVYAVGWYQSGSAENAAYWRDGLLTKLESNGRATGMYVTDAGATYISGYYNDGSKNVAAYWVVDGGTVSRQDLYSASSASATDIFVDGDGVVFTSGYYSNGTHDVAVYWTFAGGTVNTVELFSTGLSQATGIVLDGSGIVNVVGVYQDVSIQAGLWRTDAAGLISLNSSSAFGRAVGIVDGTVNAVGDFTDGSVRRSAVWDGVSELLLPMSGGATAAYAYGAHGHDGVLYVAGSNFTGSNEVAVYWKGNQIVLLSGSVRSRANSVYTRE